MPELQVTIDGSGAQRGAGVVTSALRRIRGGTAQAEKGQDRLNRRFREGSRTAQLFKRAIVGIGFAVLARGIIKAADAFTNINNRIRLVTETQGELVAVQEELFAISQRTRLSFEENAEVFNRLALSTKDLGLSLQDTLEFTESLNQAVIISGASATEASAGLIQLSQGLASGALRGDELRSVLEQLPAVADVIAGELGVTRGELRRLGEEGKITADIVTRAFANAREELSERFGQTVPTISQGFTVLQNAITRAIGKFTEATGAAGGFAQILIDLAAFIEGPFLRGLLEFGDALSLSLAEFSKVGDEISAQFAQIEVDTGELTAFLADAFTRLPLNIATFFRIIVVEVFGLIDRLETRVAMFINNVGSEFRKVRAAFVGGVATLLGDDAVAEEAFADFERALSDQVNTAAFLERELLAEQLEIQAKRDEIANDIADNQRQIIEAVEDRARAEAAVSGVNLDAARGDGQFRLAADDAKALEKAVTATLTPLETLNMELSEIARLQGLAEKAGRLDEFGDALARMRVEALDEFQDAIGGIELDPVVEAQNRLNEALVVFNQLTEGDAGYAQAAGVVDSLEQSLINAQLAAAGLSDLDTLLFDALPTGEQFEQLIAPFERLREEGRITEEQYDAIGQAIKDKLGKSLIDLEELGKQAARNLQDAFADFLFDPFDDGLDGLLRNFGETLRRMASEVLSQQILSSLFSSFGGAGGFLGGLGGAFAEGGDFSGGRPILVGERGPELITPRQPGTVIPNNMLGNMQMPAPEVNVAPTPVVVLDDPRKIGRALQSDPETQRALVDTIAQKSGSVNQALGRQQ